MRKNTFRVQLIALVSFLFFYTHLYSQNVVDNCFTSVTPSPNSEFASSANVVNIYSSDVISWTGMNWVGGFTAANLTIPPPTNLIGCRAIFLGSGTVWTSGGESIGLKLNAPLVGGTTYTFSITSVSHGLGSNGNFTPSFYTNTTASLTGAVLAGSLTSVGNTWTTNDFSFVASAAQNGNIWIILKTEPNDSSGLINSFCVNCTTSTVNCSVSVNSVSVCEGTLATVTATPSTTGNYSYQWTVPTGFTNPGNVSSFGTTVGGNYSVVITNLATSCSANATGVVTVNTLPVVSVNSPTICVGASATIIATPSTAGNYSYQWTVPTGFTNPGNVSSFNTTVGGNYSVVITNLATSCSANATGVVTVNALPVVSVNSPTICEGVSATVTATPATAGNYSYQWTVPTGFTNPGNVSSFSTTVAGNYSVVVGNFATSCSANSSGIVTINALPVVSVNSPTVCEGVSATVTATPSTAGNYSYQWTVPTGFTNPGNVGSFSTTVGGNYSVIITNLDSNCISNSASGTVTVFPDFDFTIAQYCDGNNFILEVVPDDTSFTVADSNIVWQLNNTMTIGNNNTLDLSSYLSSTPTLETLPLTISVSVTSDNGCVKTNSLVVEKVYCGIQKGISPNNDGSNDFFDLSLLGVSNLSIFNRYGSKVFQKSNYTNQWIGQSDKEDELPDGVYYYLIEFKDNSAAKSGWIYLLREYN